MLYNKKGGSECWNGSRKKKRREEETVGLYRELNRGMT
jgi:hypothetical protein